MLQESLQSRLEAENLLRTPTAPQGKRLLGALIRSCRTAQRSPLEDPPPGPMSETDEQEFTMDQIQAEAHKGSLSVTIGWSWHW
jgi:hypothetical protein